VLALEFFVPGFTTTFSKNTLPGLPDLKIDLSFDGEIEIDVIVPSDSTVPLSIFPNGQAQFDATNFQVSAANTWTGFVMSLAALVSVIEGKGFPNFDPPNSKDLVDITQLGFVTPLSDAFKGAAYFGFTQLGAQINANPPAPAPSGNTIEIDIIHPADPGPQLRNALTPPGPVFLPPQIGLAAPEVPAGSQVGVNGSEFPAAQATQLKISWIDTTSGAVFLSDVLWGPSPSPGVPPQQPTSVVIDRTIHDSTFTATGLTPGTEYGFLVRDFDAEGLVATGWSVPATPQPPDPQPWGGIWTFLTTQATEQVDLVLSYQNTDLGTATLQTDGTFATTVTVPASVPAGTYLVTAMLAGQPMAQAPITVLPQGQVPPAVLQVIDPISDLPVQGTATVVGGVPVNLRGQGFTPGTVNLWVDSIGGTSLGSATADQAGSFTAASDWPSTVIGAHQILAEEGPEQATAGVWAEGAPQ